MRSINTIVDDNTFSEARDCVQSHGLHHPPRVPRRGQQRRPIARRGRRGRKAQARVPAEAAHGGK
jgi:hypothetical protein